MVLKEVYECSNISELSQQIKIIQEIKEDMPSTFPAYLHQRLYELKFALDDFVLGIDKKVSIG